MVTLMPALECQRLYGSNSVCRQATPEAVGGNQMAYQVALHPYMGIVAGIRRQEDCRSRSGANAEPTLVL